MAVPEFSRFIRPALELLADGQPRHVNEIEAGIVPAFHLGQADLEDRTPSGSITRVRDRTQWALTYLRQARLIEPAGRGVSRITARGAEYLKRAPEVIKPALLEEFEEFRAFHRRSRPKGGNGAPTQEDAVAPPQPETPEEAIASAFVEHNAALAEQVLDRVKSMTPAFFERLIVQLMLKLGYGGIADDAGSTLGRSGDGGVDGVIKLDKLGLENVYLQAKRWGDGVVGRKEVQAFVGALSGQGASKGVFITTSTFSADARRYAADNKAFKLSLVDGRELSRLMMECDLGVALVLRYDVKRIDSDYFTE